MESEDERLMLGRVWRAILHTVVGKKRWTRALTMEDGDNGGGLWSIGGPVVQLVMPLAHLSWSACSPIRASPVGCLRCWWGRTAVIGDGLEANGSSFVVGRGKVRTIVSGMGMSAEWPKVAVAVTLPLLHFAVGGAPLGITVA
eukprot:CAMPEP_0171118052 /NCGR_PEP_ID=MMETSP0766_2-20121228/93880_1 /TAXON_ID=439317 /ORGANISM="Gambierdiscus australes, Strain CAWD 149" /LENGTH=142 /DNA_ID=CAMNT_0011580605 /DNA_START=117 /DNA_END=542 /DNA_ORIENTATION=-